MKALAWAFAAGLLFGAGLCLSGMADPRNVVGFLDVTGAWNPRLLAVMGGAVAVHAGLLWWRREKEGRYLAPLARPWGVDAPLVAGAATFGVGWGLSGYCPGPAILSLGFGTGNAAAFVAAMLVGALAADVALAGRAEATSCADLGA